MTEKNKSIRNFPTLRFLGFDLEKNSYKKYLFKDIFLFSTGKNIKQNEASPEFETFCVRYGELYHMYSEVIKEVINKTDLDKTELIFSEGDEILLPSAGEDPLDIGLASALTIANVAIGRTINILKPMSSDVYSQIYVSYYINHKLRRKISNLAKGSSISNVYNSDLKTLEIILPNVNEQKKVANFLSLLDDRIITQRKIISHLETLMKNSQENIFNQKLKLKKENGNNFPEWKIKKLGDLLIESKEKSREKNQYRIISSTAKGLFYQDDYFTRDIASQDNTGYKILKKNQLVFSPQNLWLGNINVNSDFEVGLVSPSYKIFNFDEKLTSASFCKYYLKTSAMLFEFGQSSIQGASVVRRNLDLNMFFNIQIQIPSIDEQTKIANFLSAIAEKIETEKKILAQYQTQKKYLLANLFA